MAAQVGRNVADAQAPSGIAIVLEFRQLCRRFARHGRFAPSAVEREKFYRIAALVVRQDLEQCERRTGGEGLGIDGRCSIPGLPRFLVSAQVSEGAAQQFMRPDLARVELNRSTERRNSLAGRRLKKSPAVPHPGFGMPGINRRSAMQFGRGGLRVAGVEPQPPSDDHQLNAAPFEIDRFAPAPGGFPPLGLRERGVGAAAEGVGVAWIEMRRALKTSERLFVVTEMAPRFAEIVMEVGVARIAMERTLEQLDGNLRFAALAGKHAEQTERFGVTRIERKRLAVCTLSLGDAAIAVMRHAFANQGRDVRVDGGWIGAAHCRRLHYALPPCAGQPGGTS